MPARLKTLYRLFVVLLLACGLVQAATVGVSTAEPGTTTSGYVKYYTVAASNQGGPEDLTDIAVRFLGNAERSAEIYALNAGRPQADGTGLTDPRSLRAGWVLVLPWDAVGDGIRYGLLPATHNPGTSDRPTSNKPATSGNPVTSEKPATSGGSASTPDGRGGPRGGATDPRNASKPSTRSGDGSRPTNCGGKTIANKQSTWAQQQLAPGHAWERSRGDGVMVAVVDSGVDASLPQLSGRVAVGADVTTGNGHGDSDCLGSGTAMAGIIAGNSDQPDMPSGMAPDATVLPIRVVTKGATAKATDAANAIEVAVSTGASVIAVGSFVSLTEPEVSAAVSRALTQDVLIVAPAPTEPVTVPEPPEGAGAPGALLSVGGIGPDGKLVAQYEESTVDVVAPGADVASLGINGNGTVNMSGSQYAVAFVAGQASLVRSAYPELNATQVKHRIEVTAERMGAEPPDKQYGWGMIKPAAAVSATIEGEVAAAPPDGGGGGGGLARTVAIMVVVFILLAAVALLLLRARRWARGSDLASDDPDESSAPGPTAQSEPAGRPRR
ncbi:S8 family serine peptidase [Plantactinospora sp. WMMB334]|uniref:S8 family serine peptidase n=1 Tax=Plantactinospora sp. WMMB334 TaxID=3404119 RepID=UPI003B960488